MKGRCLRCLSFCLGPEGESPRGPPGDPHTKKSRMLRGKLDFRDWRPVYAWFRLFWPLNLGNTGLFIFTEIFLDIKISLCKSISRPDLPRKSKTLIVIVVIFFREYSLGFMGVKMPIFRITQLSYVT